ncbi:hypothetical protein BH09ACT6_BH09ACT6_09980 [soil metagenome]
MHLTTLSPTRSPHRSQGRALAGVALAVGLSFVVSGVQAMAAVPAAETTALVSERLPPAATGGDDDAADSATSADGRYVVFVSRATTLTGTDNHGHVQAYRRDTLTGSTVTVSVNNTDGSGANDNVASPTLSGDGRFVAFITPATDVTSEGTGGYAQLFVRDLLNSTTELASVSLASTPAGGSANVQGAAISLDGSHVAFATSATDLTTASTNGHLQAFERDLVGHTTAMVSINGGAAPSGGNGDTSEDLAISSDGRYVAFTSDATDLTAAASHGVQQVYRRDVTAGTTTLISVEKTGTSGGDKVSGLPTMSANGSFIAFTSGATDLTAVSSEGHSQVYVHDQSGTNMMVSVSTSATPKGANDDSGNTGLSMSADGRRLVFASKATDLTSVATGGHNQIYLADAGTSGFAMLSPAATAGTGGAGDSVFPRLSADGTAASFTSIASNLTSTPTNAHAQVYTRKITSGSTAMVSVAAPPPPSGGDDNSSSPVVSADGRFVAFSSAASDLTDVSNFDHAQGYLRDLTTDSTTLITPSKVNGSGANADSLVTSTSADGRYVVFTSTATDLTPELTGNHSQVFLRDVVLNTTTLISAAVVGVVTPTGANGDSSSGQISADGHHVAFVSFATNLTPDAAGPHSQVFERDLVTATTGLVTANDAPSPVALNADVQGAPAISADGALVAFATDATDVLAIPTGSYTQVYLRDTRAKTSTLVSSMPGAPLTAGDGPSSGPVLSAIGSTVAFSSAASLTATPPGSRMQAYSRSMNSGSTMLVSADDANTGPGDFDSLVTSISSNGSYVAFSSKSTNLASQSTRGVTQEFRRDVTHSVTDVVSVDENGIAGGVDSAFGELSADGQHVAFVSAAPLTGSASAYLQVFERTLAPWSEKGTGEGAGTGAGASSHPGTGGGALAKTGLNPTLLLELGSAGVVAGLVAAGIAVARRRRH